MSGFNFYDAAKINEKERIEKLKAENSKNMEIVVDITSYMEQFLNIAYDTMSQDERVLIEKIGNCLHTLLENLKEEDE